MNLRINLKYFALTLLLSFGCSVKAGVTESNPGEIAALTKGEAMVNETISKQEGTQTGVTGNLGTMYLQIAPIQKWERNYMNYLEKGYNYASTVLACSSLYADGVRTFMNLIELNKALSHNPQGPFASISMTNIYMEVATELVEVYKLIKIAAGPSNMNLLTGSERSQILWYLSQKMESLNKKLHHLALCVSIYSFQDVWNQATLGMAEKSHGQIAREAFGRMKNACYACNALYRK